MTHRKFLPFAATAAAVALVGAALIWTPRHVAAAPTHATGADLSAAGAAARMNKAGIVKNYPDGKFHGDKPVTRYEMAVVLDRFVRYIEQARKPLRTDTPVTYKAPAGTPADVAAAQTRLVQGHFLPADSPILKTPGSKPVTADQFTNALSATVIRLSDRSLPPTPNTDNED